MYGTSTIPTKNNKYSDSSNKNNSTIIPYLASRLRVATVTARLVVVSDAGALVALCIQNQNGLVLRMTNIRNGRSLYSIDQDVGLGTRSTEDSKSRSASSGNDRDHEIPSPTSWVLL